MNQSPSSIGMIKYQQLISATQNLKSFQTLIQEQIRSGQTNATSTVMNLRNSQIATISSLIQEIQSLLPTPTTTLVGLATLTHSNSTFPPFMDFKQPNPTQKIISKPTTPTTPNPWVASSDTGTNIKSNPLTPSLIRGQVPQSLTQDLMAPEPLVLPLSLKGIPYESIIGPYLSDPFGFDLTPIKQ